MLAALVPAPAQAQEKLPVPFSFLPAAVLAGTQVYADPPGANDWTCRPTRKRPRPVVLVHGLVGNKNTNWQTFAPLLKNRGYCVFALTYGVGPAQLPGLDQFGGLTRIERSAAELKRFVNRVLRSTGAKKVDILGHSEGTVVPNYYAKFLGGRTKIRSYVSIAPLWHGTNVAGAASLVNAGTAFGLTPPVIALLSPVFGSGPQLLTGSAFWDKMRRGGTPRVKGIRYTNIVTRYDQLVMPYTSGVQRGMRNVVLQDVCPQDYSEHFQVVASRNTARLVLRALAGNRSTAVPCARVLPYVGP